jgi:hypothetical protein
MLTRAMGYDSHYKLSSCSRNILKGYSPHIHIFYAFSNSNTKQVVVACA